MKTMTAILTVTFIAAGCSFALAQAGGTGGGGGGAGAGAGASAGASGGATGGTGATGAGSDQRARVTAPGVLRRGDDMAPLMVPREETYVRMQRMQPAPRY